jgi:hypothetical protein
MFDEDDDEQVTPLSVVVGGLVELDGDQDTDVDDGGGLCLESLMGGLVLVHGSGVEASLLGLTGLLSVTSGLSLLGAATVFSLLCGRGHGSVVIWHQEREGQRGEPAAVGALAIVSAMAPGGGLSDEAGRSDRRQAWVRKCSGS